MTSSRNRTCYISSLELFFRGVERQIGGGEGPGGPGTEKSAKERKDAGYDACCLREKDRERKSENDRQRERRESGRCTVS